MVEAVVVVFVECVSGGMWVCGQCRWWIGLWMLDWRGDVWKPVAGLVEVNVGAVYGWCINSK